MSLRVLLADDNITAQRMASKILTDAGYEVIAVSNGAAAIKKIASEKPELLILDIYMPGYTGLEVCEKVKNDPATAQTPIILTVTNMEPFNPQDGNRVRADGVMIKPFEASDLLAVVQKYEAKSAKATPPADYAHTQAISTEAFKDASYEEWKSEAPDEPETEKMQMSAEMAAAPALGFDEHMAEPAMVTPAADFAVDAPAFGTEAEAAPAFAAAPAPLEWTPAPEAASEIPASLEASAEIAPPAELEFTSAPQVGDIAVTPAAELETADVTHEVATFQDPALVTNPDELAQFATSVGVEHPEEIVVGVAMPGLAAEEVPAEVAPEPIAEEPDAFVAPAPADDYDTTVKMKAYEAPPAMAEALSEVVPEPVAQAPAEMAEPSPVEHEMQRAFAAGAYGAAVAPASAVAPTSSYIAAPEPGDLTRKLVAEFAAELDQAHQERVAMGQIEPAVEEAPLTEASMPMAPEVPASQLDEEKIAAAVTRALDKYKEGLRAELIATIVRELKQ